MNKKDVLAEVNSALGALAGFKDPSLRKPQQLESLGRCWELLNRLQESLTKEIVEGVLEDHFMGKVHTEINPPDDEDHTNATVIVREKGVEVSLTSEDGSHWEGWSSWEEVIDHVSVSISNKDQT